MSQVINKLFGTAAAPTAASLDQKANVEIEAALAASSTSVVPISSAVRSVLGRRSRSRHAKRNAGEKTFSLFSSPMMRPGIVSNNKVYRFQQDVEFDAWLTASASVEEDKSQSFQLSQLDNLTGFVDIFDQYRIVQIEAWITPRTSITTTTGNMGLLWSVVDYDDANSTTIAFLREFQNALVAPGFCAHYRKWQPHVAIAAYSGAFTSFANEASPWVDCASPNVAHYALKAGVSQTDAAYVWDMVARFTVEFRNTR